MSRELQPVLILGAGINGAALARELVLNCVPVCLVDTHDIASGATSASSRLIHGGLRYLEYGEFDLVRESLAERTRLLRLAPQFVQPLRLYIPLRSRLGGLAASAGRFLGWSNRARRASQGRTKQPGQTISRGLWVVGAGLKFYDTVAKDPSLPRHRRHVTGHADSLSFDREQFPWQCSYYDAQIRHPPRLVLAMLEDARQLAVEHGVRFDVLTYRQTRLNGRTAEITSTFHEGSVCTVAPAAIVNATGAWVDLTLKTLNVPSVQLMGGTKGSHFVTSHPGLKEFLGPCGVYAEAHDGRPFFVLPMAESVLVGTTDEPFSGDPREAAASQKELDYLIGAVNHVLPDIPLSADDIDWHYSGVRPLPFSDGSTPGSITRRHWLQPHPEFRVPCFSVIGGKLTTCRSLAECATKAVLDRLGLPLLANSQEREFPGGENYPASEVQRCDVCHRLAAQSGCSLEQVHAVWTIVGSRTKQLLGRLAPRPDTLDGTPLLTELARYVIENEWVATLDDLVERRLMLLDHPRLTATCLHELAGLLVQSGKLSAGRAAETVRDTITHLAQRYVKRVKPTEPAA